jgi:multisubunit Na+/H+ antiporter MnhC subunit
MFTFVGSDTKSLSVGGIVGGVVSALIVIALIVVLVVLLLRKAITKGMLCLHILSLGKFIFYFSSARFSMDNPVELFLMNSG